MSKTYLKIKIKSLSDEAKIIRKEELKAKAKGYRSLCKLRDAGHTEDPPFFFIENPNYRLFNGLKEHREGIVRSETRAALIAYGFLRGRAYAQIENSTAGLLLRPAAYDQKYSGNELWDRVGRLIAKYGPKEKLAQWGTQSNQGSEKIHYNTLHNWVAGQPVNK